MKVIQEIQDYLGDYRELKGDLDIITTRRLKILNGLTQLHLDKCKQYRGLTQMIGSCKRSNTNGIESIPMIPVNVFKETLLKSVNENEIYRILRSSGTTGKPSLICLDRMNAVNQSKALSRLFSDFLGLARPNILVVDKPSVLKAEKEYSARKAGIVGFGSLCKKRFFALKEDMTIDLNSIQECIASDNREFLVYGFTYILWKHLVLEQLPQSIKEVFGRRAILLHGGGWKKLSYLDVNNEDFRNKVRGNLGIDRIHEYYGMVEQTGSIIMSCHHGVLHENAFATVVARDPINILRVVKDGEEGIAQVLSCLPTSYPGHSLITEDLVVVIPGYECRCGRRGKAFRINGRIKQAEVRGCSDTYREGL